MKKDIEIGRFLHNYLKNNGIQITWLAEQLHCDRKKLYSFFKSDYCDLGFLFDICVALDCDFFPYLSNKLAQRGISRQA